jgi:hypothetical protein
MFHYFSINNKIQKNCNFGQIFLNLIVAIIYGRMQRYSTYWTGSKIKYSSSDFLALSEKTSEDRLCNFFLRFTNSPGKNIQILHAV